MRLFFLLVALISSHYFSSESFASEGFKTLADLSPMAVENGYGGVYFAGINLGTKLELGSAFLFRTVTGPSETELYFLAIGHLFREACRTPGPCAQLLLSKEARLIYDAVSRGYLSGKTLSQVRGPVEVLKLSQIPDLAILKAKVPNFEASNYKVLSLSKNCHINDGDPIYAIGFPATYFRAERSGHLIASPDLTIKRWSKGIFIDLVKTAAVEDQLPGIYMATSLDSLYGNSGGPVMNESGEVIGVMKASESSADNGYAYIGVEDFGNRRASSYAVQCQDMLDFIK